VEQTRRLAWWNFALRLGIGGIRIRDGLQQGLRIGVERVA
jgi:hypothetical protein